MHPLHQVNMQKEKSLTSYSRWHYRRSFPSSTTTLARELLHHSTVTHCTTLPLNIMLRAFLILWTF